MKVKIVKEVKRSDGLWRFACGDVFTLISIDTIELVLVIILYQGACLAQKNLHFASTDISPTTNRILLPLANFLSWQSTWPFPHPVSPSIPFSTCLGWFWSLDVRVSDRWQIKYDYDTLNVCLKECFFCESCYVINVSGGNYEEKIIPVS